jgi:polysaccharide transporter, PST family
VTNDKASVKLALSFLQKINRGLYSIALEAYKTPPEAALTSIQSVLAAFAIIVIDLLGRAGLDKVLALSGGPTVVALWAQLQSVVELVSSVTAAGVLQGLTVLIAQVIDPRDERSLLRDALKLGLGTSLAMALIVVLASPQLVVWLTQNKIETELFLLAALAGCITVVPATLNAYWLGKHQQQRMLGLALLTSVTLLLVAASAWFGLHLRGLMWVQSFMLAILGMVIWRYLQKMSRDQDSQNSDAEYFRKLLKFVPVGLAIGIMSPVSMLLVRGMLSNTLSWSDVGFLQALWRSTEWVTATAAGVLSLIFLPRFSATYGSKRFNGEMLRAGVMVLIPAACLLLLIFFNQRAMLVTLYDARFVVSDETAALIMLGSWVRIASWVFLFGLFSAHRTGLIIAGEILSLPLYALLLWLFSDGMTLERTALLYCVSYLVYLCFNAIALRYSASKVNGSGDHSRFT